MNKILLMVIRCTRVLLTTSRPLAADGVPERSEAYANGRMFDISHRVAKDLSSWDSKDGLGQFLFPLASIKNGSDVNASETKMSVRTGTHVNAPSHMFYNYSNVGFDADSLDLQVLNGPALLVDVPIRDRNITEQTGFCKMGNEPCTDQGKTWGKHALNCSIACI